MLTRTSYFYRPKYVRHSAKGTCQFCIDEVPRCAQSHFDEGFLMFIEEKEGILLEALSLWRQLIWNEDEILW